MTMLMVMTALVEIVLLLLSLSLHPSSDPLLVNMRTHSMMVRCSAVTVSSPSNCSNGVTTLSTCTWECQMNGRGGGGETVLLMTVINHTHMSYITVLADFCTNYN